MKGFDLREVVIVAIGEFNLNTLVTFRLGLFGGNELFERFQHHGRKSIIREATSFFPGFRLLVW